LDRLIHAPSLLIQTRRGRDQNDVSIARHCSSRSQPTIGHLNYFLFPHHVNYHIAHHLYPAVPHYNLPALHAALQRHGLLEGAQVSRLYATLPRIFAEPHPAA
jgi:fatty acid desaturase